MKNLILFVVGSIIWQSCVKDCDNPIVKGKLVHRSCASIVVQVLDSNYYYLGQPAWEAPDEAKTMYKNVFLVENGCRFPAMNIGTEFNFKVICKDNNNCAVCMLYDAPPQKKQMIKVLGQ